MAFSIENKYVNKLLVQNKHKQTAKEVTHLEWTFIGVTKITYKI